MASIVWDAECDVTRTYGLLDQEVERCRDKFSTSRFLLPALIEEVGELAEAMCAGDRAAIRKEAIQVACVAVRIAEEIDPIDYGTSKTVRAAIALGLFVRAAIAGKGGVASMNIGRLIRAGKAIDRWSVGDYVTNDTCFATRSAEEGKP